MLFLLLLLLVAIRELSFPQCLRIRLDESIQTIVDPVEEGSARWQNRTVKYYIDVLM